MQCHFCSTIKISPVYQRTPVFIIANGPSLDESIAVIKAHKDRAILISCGSAMTALHKVGIKPDIHVETERTKSVYDLLISLNDPDYQREILFLSSDVIHPDCSTLFNKSMLTFKLGEPGVTLYQNHFPHLQPCAAFSGMNPLVGNIGVSLPINLGFKNIYLFGMDNGYRQRGHHHSKFSAYYNNNVKAEAFGEKAYGDSQRVCEGNFGGVVISNIMFDTSRRVTEEVLAANGDVQCFNCSDGAKIEMARPLPSTEIHLSQSINKSALIEEITGLGAPITLSKQDLYPLLDIDFFNVFIDKMTDDWQCSFSSRNELNQLMLRNFGYLAQIAATKQKHIAQVMIGSMNYIFSLLSTLLYSFEGEEKTLELMEPAIDLWLEFLSKVRDMYPRALDSVDMIDDHQTMDLFKK